MWTLRHVAEIAVTLGVGFLVGYIVALYLDQE
jgi:hypothetical protein